MEPIINIKQGDFFVEAPSLESNRYELILTDPPYAILNRDGRNTWDQEIDLEALAEVYARVITKTGQLIFFSSFRKLLTSAMVFEKYFDFKHFFIWAKPGGMPVNQYNPIQDTEHIMVFKPKSVKASELTFNPKATLRSGTPYRKKNYSKDVSIRTEQKADEDVNERGDRYVRTVLNAPSKPNMEMSERTSHPTQKPLILLRELIRVHSNPGDHILDSFAGSGSTAIAALIENRHCDAFELN